MGKADRRQSGSSNIELDGPPLRALNKDWQYKLAKERGRSEAAMSVLNSSEKPGSPISTSRLPIF